MVLPSRSSVRCHRHVVPRMSAAGGGGSGEDGTRGGAVGTPCRATAVAAFHTLGPNTAAPMNTATIPIGQIGNDRPIEITDERWESPDLKVLVLSRHHDPQTGDVEYRLTNISRGEPPPDLFMVPADYTVLAGGPSVAPVPAQPARVPAQPARPGRP